MEKKKGIIVVAAIALIVIVYGAIMVSGRGIKDDSIDGQFVQVVENNGCLQCHTAEPAKFWYQKMPGFAGLFEKDMKNAERFIDLQVVVDKVNAGERITLPEIAKIEQSTLNKSMPVKQYSVVHWGSSLNAKEQQIVFDWIASAKSKATLESNDLAEMGYVHDFTGSEPIQPLPQVAEFTIDHDKAMLGLKLYHDTRLSVDSTVACATCHPLDSVGRDGTRFSRGVGGKVGGINAPSVYNAAYNFQQFWNGRLPDLQAQAGGPPLNPVEMGYASFDEIVEVLNKDPVMRADFARIYGNEGITQATITDAIAEFEWMLITPNSKFDKYLKGDKAALTADEAKGYKIFKENYCATCHVGPSMGGQSYEYLGTVKDAALYFQARGTEISEDDLGRFGNSGSGVETDKYKYKVPNLRNVALTGPWFHDGTQLTLEQAVRTMFEYNTPNQNPTDEEVKRVVDFLNTLNGENEYLSYPFVPSNTLR